MPLTNYRPRGDIKAHWEAANPILKQREMGIEWEFEIGKGKAKIKFGNGTSAWNSLDYGIVDDITQKTIDSFVATSGNNALVEGDTMDVIAGKLNAQREYWNTLTGADRAQAFFDSLSGLSNDDFVGVMTWLNSKKLDANLVYNGTDSTNKSQALAAPVGKQLKELTDTNATAISTLNSNFPKAGTSSPAFDGSNISNTSMILYKISDANWAGVGCNGQGKPILRLGTSENYKAVYRFDMDGLYFNNTNIIASEKKNASGLNSFSLGGDYYVRKYSNGLGVAVFTNIIIPQITTNGWIEMVRLPFTMLENAAFRVNLSRGGTHAGIRDAIFTGTVLSAYLTTADSGAEISINAAINLVI